MQKNKYFKLWGPCLAAVFSLIMFVGASPTKPDEKAELRKNKKGDVTEWIYRRDGDVYKREYDRNGDGKADFRVLENHGRFVRKEYDQNYDGQFEKIEKPLATGSSGHIKTIDTENAPN